MNIIYIFKNNNSVRFSSFTKIDDLCCTYFYRLVSERTIEENILKKANQKRLLGDLAIEGGNFTTAYFKSVSLLNLLQLFLQDFLNIFFFAEYNPRLVQHRSDIRDGGPTHVRDRRESPRSTSNRRGLNDSARRQVCGGSFGNRFSCLRGRSGCSGNVICLFNNQKFFIFVS